MPFSQSTIAQHRFIEITFIARGAFGNVYRATDQRLRRTIAVKEIQANLSPDEHRAARLRFEHEAQIVAQLNSPQIVAVYGYDEDVQQGEEYLYLEYVPYGTLAGVLAERRTLTEREATLIGRDIARAIAAHWSIDVVHRDIKPSNVLLLRDSEGNISGAKLTDYGIAQDLRATQRTRVGQGHPGTSSYMSPEQATSQRALTAASDLYNVGLLLWEMLAGTPRYKHDSEPITTATLDASSALLRVVQRALEPDVKQRYENPAEMIRDLDAALAAPIPTKRLQPEAQPINNRRAWTIGVIVGVLLVAMVGVGSVLASMNSRETGIVLQPTVPTSSANATVVAVVTSSTATTTSTPTSSPTMTPTPTSDSTGTAVANQTATAQAQIEQSATAQAQQATALAQAQQATALAQAQQATALAQAQQATALAQAQQATALALQVPPTPTVKPIIPLRAFPISIENVANDNISNILPNFPKGNRKLGNISFFIPEQSNKASTQCSSRPNWPTSFNITVNNIQNPEMLYLLVSAGYTFNRSTERIGVVQVNFADGRSLFYDLVLGRNIREWRVEVPETVGKASSSDLAEVYRGVSSDGDTGVLDMLKLYIPDDHKAGTIKSITIHDVSQEVVGSGDPCMFIAGVTILARN